MYKYKLFNLYCFYSFQLPSSYTDIQVGCSTLPRRDKCGLKHVNQFKKTKTDRIKKCNTGAGLMQTILCTRSIPIHKAKESRYIIMK